MSLKSKFSILALFLFNIHFLFGKRVGEIEFKNGDLIFVESSSANISGAINRVTQLTDDKNYSHVGIVQLHGDEIWVLHASSENGSERISLADFVGKESKGDRGLDIYRLSAEYQGYIPEALTVANELLGLPYNFSYVLSDTSLYCSDYIQRIFEKEKIFELNPMTFINPSTSEIDSVWISYYTKLCVDVPEGQLGCNPNGLAASEKLIFVGRYLDIQP